MFSFDPDGILFSLVKFQGETHTMIFHINGMKPKIISSLLSNSVQLVFPWGKEKKGLKY